MRGSPPRGAADWLLAGVLRAVQPAYALGVGRNNRRFDLGRAAVSPVPEGVRVVSVGNLTLGGSGKTPLTLALAEEFARRGRRVAVVLRGHGGRAAKEGRTLVVSRPGEPADLSALDPAETGDEALLYATRLRGMGVVVARRRAEGVALAARELKCGAILLDDGFQHRKQARSADVLLFDASLPPAAYQLFPRGYLREPLANAGRASAVAMEAESEALAREKASALGLPWRADQPALLYGRSLAGAWRVPSEGEAPTLPESLEPLGRFRGRGKAFWFAGIAHPERFANGLAAEGIAFANGAPLPDHEPFAPERIAGLAGQARASGADFALATEKDAAKLLGRWPSEKAAPPLWAVRLEARLRDPGAWVRACLGEG